MKKGAGIGGLVIIGLIVWWLTQRKPAQTAELSPGETYLPESEYEKLHTTVPITKYVERTIPVFQEGG